MSTPPQRQRRRAIRIFVVLLGVAAFLALVRPCWTYFRAAAILLRVQAPQHPGALANFSAYPIEEVLTEVPTPSQEQQGGELAQCSRPGPGARRASSGHRRAAPGRLRSRPVFERHPRTDA